MYRPKVKLPSGLTVRHGDMVIVTIVGRYNYFEDSVRVPDLPGKEVFRAYHNLTADLAEHGDSVTVAKLKGRKGGKDE